MFKDYIFKKSDLFKKLSDYSKVQLSAFACTYGLHEGDCVTFAPLQYVAEDIDSVWTQHGSYISEGRYFSGALGYVGISCILSLMRLLVSMESQMIELLRSL